MERDDQQEAWAHQLMQERYEMNVDALKRCLKAGASPEDIKFIAGECGIDIRHITIKGSHEQIKSD